MSKSLTQYAANAMMPTLSEDDFGAALAETEYDVGGGGTTFLKFSGKSGIFAIGQDNDDLDPDQLYIVEPQSFTEGFICWKDGSKADGHQWSLLTPKSQKMRKEDLMDHGPYGQGDGWNVQWGFGIIALDKKNTQLKFENNSKSGVSEMKKLHREISERFKAGDPYIPIIYFDAEEFTHKGNTNWKPMFLRDVWVTRAAINSYAAGDLTIKQLVSGDAPKKAKKSKAKKAPARKRK